MGKNYNLADQDVSMSAIDLVLFIPVTQLSDCIVTSSDFWAGLYPRGATSALAD